ncbi:MAG: aminotransferase class IV [Pyrinomonadaceae bacterium]
MSKRHEYVFFDGELRRAADASIAALSRAALYGRGVFTTLRLIDGRPFLWEKHWRRLVDNAARLTIDLTDHSEDTILAARDELISQNAATNGRARITIFDGSPSPMWPAGTERGTSVLISTAGPRIAPAEFRITVSPYRVNSTSPLAGVKSCNYLENLMALDEARERGFDEAVRLNERGEVASASMANIFWLRDGRLYTPALATGCLPGTTREHILENVECSEVSEPVDALHCADAIFLTSAGLGIKSVAFWNDKPLTGSSDAMLRLSF